MTVLLFYFILFDSFVRHCLAGYRLILLVCCIMGQFIIFLWSVSARNFFFWFLKRISAIRYKRLISFMRNGIFLFSLSNNIFYQVEMDKATEKGFVSRSILAIVSLQLPIVLRWLLKLLASLDFNLAPKFISGFFFSGEKKRDIIGKRVRARFHFFPLSVASFCLQESSCCFCWAFNPTHFLFPASPFVCI